MMMKSFLVVWGDDEEVMQILNRCRQAIAPDGRLLIIEPILKPMNEFDSAKFFDLHIMALHNGRLRSEVEYSQLLEKTGFLMGNRHELPSGFSIIEATPVTRTTTV